MNNRLKKLLVILMLVFLFATPILAADVNEVQKLQSDTANITEILPDQNQVYRAIMSQQAIYPDGTPWGDDKYYESKGSGDGSLGLGCHAFALVLSDAAFGDYSFNRSSDLNNIRIGDILRMYGDTHAGIVIGINGNTLTIAEGNYNHSVKWGRSIQRNEVNYYFTRYHDSSEFEKPSYIPVQNMYLAVTKTSIYGKTSRNLSDYVYFTPADATNKNLRWSSSDPSVATVDANGNISAVKNGKVVITVVSEDGGFTSSCEIQVDGIWEAPPHIDVTGLEVNPTKITINVGEYATINAKVLPDNASNKNVYWRQDDANEFVIEDKNFTSCTIKGIRPGTSKITAVTDENNYQANCLITVIKEETQAPTESDNSSKPEDSPSIPEVNNQNNNSEKQAVFRLYNNNSNEHLYTTDENEDSSLIRSGWKDEGINWYAPNSGTPVYRLYSPVTGAHLYTSDTNEINELTLKSGWNMDKDSEPMFYSGGSIPVYRLYNENLRMHLLTTDKNEYDVLGNSGWNQEGIGFYANSLASNSSTDDSQSKPESDNSSSTELKISPSRSELLVGQTQQFTVTGSNNVTWRSTNPEVATINNSGLATAVSTGFCWIGAKSGATEELVPIYVIQKSNTSRGITGINFGPRENGMMPSLTIQVSSDQLGKVKYDWFDLMKKSFETIHLSPTIYISKTSNPQIDDYYELSDLQSNCESLFTFSSDEPSIVSYDSNSKEFKINGYGTAMIYLKALDDPSIISPLSTPSGYSAFMAIDIESK